MTAPRYQPLLKANIPTVQLDDDAGEVRVIAGAFNETPGPASTFTPINVWDMRLAAGKSVQLTIPVGHNTILFVRAGAVEVLGGDGKAGTVGSAQAAILTMEGTTVNVKVLYLFK
jgi:redox-sensitive bicupin YhaK (pirin superfamily)